ncbi:hypothetical protein Ddye_016249 [Dipteronia dyeriana]|uniref:Reverse transcriptase domain-containing protein n=1 Tax=Dipteronia dyeriana TaxID=168575 RepID=A0AAD9U771_9ROSI|nr:hypothetical protein Ddye_016249 [Dipteronia dyeriana]
MVFVKNRQIVDSYVIAGEIIHSWKRNGNRGLLIKMDFEKASDNVDHDILFEVMRKIDFGEKWVEWIRWCISSLLKSVLINGYPMKEFPMERGLRMGDPLSPLLFNLVAEVLCSLKINFHKSYLDKIGKKAPGDVEWAQVFRCASATLLITYLGLPLGGNPSR